MRLYVNIDHVATLREARRTDEPDPVRAAAAAERAGADGITVHLREDRRHIQDADVRALAASVGTVLNLELGAAPEIVRIASRIDRKSTRLNSSHRCISYADFCLKKKIAARDHLQRLSGQHDYFRSYPYHQNHSADV